jgi:hypothetical protein
MKSSSFCSACYIQTVEPEMTRYDKIMEAAREIAVFEINQGKETRLIKRLEDKVFVRECPDREETVLRLAFFAAQRGFNSIVDTEVVAVKLRDGSYQRTVYTGSAVPANVSEAKLLKDRSLKSYPN